MDNQRKRDNTKNGHDAVSVRPRPERVARTVIVSTLTMIAPPAANDSVAAIVSERAARVLRRLGR